mmetsp:Transcript_12814/g.31936  ORF Transcript_12814/g.31936 Transcript_12814/m.31936 type:complete len:209 (-) Transcript_12814:3569-4195(-)
MPGLHHTKWLGKHIHSIWTTQGLLHQAIQQLRLSLWCTRHYSCALARQGCYPVWSQVTQLKYAHRQPKDLHKSRLHNGGNELTKPTIIPALANTNSDVHTNFSLTRAVGRQLSPMQHNIHQAGHSNTTAKCRVRIAQPRSLSNLSRKEFASWGTAIKIAQEVPLACCHCSDPEHRTTLGRVQHQKQAGQLLDRPAPCGLPGKVLHISN